MVQMSECRRTCWIAAGLMGLLVLALTSGAGDLGFFAGLVLGVLTAMLVGSLLVFLVCEGQPTEALTAEEKEVLGRWQRLSTARKALALGAFAVGTFGLGLTLGGLIFGRWRRA